MVRDQAVTASDGQVNSGAALIPLLTLGISGDSTAAILPGPVPERGAAKKED